MCRVKVSAEARPLLIVSVCFDRHNGGVGKRPSTEDALKAIRAIRDAPENFDLKRELAPFLLHKSNHVAAAAADTVGRLEAVALAQHLADAFLEWMKNPAERDPRCVALTARSEERRVGNARR